MDESHEKKPDPATDQHAQHHNAAKPEVETLDPANRALTDALRLTFTVLKLVMVCVVGFFIYSGAFELEENERAVVLRFGALKGGNTLAAVKEPGWHWTWPYPIEEIVKIPSAVAERELNVEAFWYDESAEEQILRMIRRTGDKLQFARDGYSLTASRSATAAGMASEPTWQAVEAGSLRPVDYGLVHTRWRIRYSISDTLLFFERLWPGEKMPEVDEYDWSAVEQLLRNVLADAVVVVSANWDIEQMWTNRKGFAEDVAAQMRARLEGLNVGLAAKLEMTEWQVPRQVKQAFDLAAGARSGRQELVRKAEARSNEILSSARSYADSLLAQAQAYRTGVVVAAAADAKNLADILSYIDEAVAQRVPTDSPDYQAKRRVERRELLAVTVDQLYQEMLREVISRADEVFVLNSPNDGSKMTFRPVLSRDAIISRGEQEQPEPAFGYGPPPASKKETSSGP